MGHCFCIPRKENETDNNNINQNLISKQQKKGNEENQDCNALNNNLTLNDELPNGPQYVAYDEDAERLKGTTQIFVQDENETLNADDIKNQSKIKIEDFVLLKVIGKGSFGKVMLVEKKDNGKSKFKNNFVNLTGKLYAMKVLKKEAIERRNQKVHTQSERQILENVKCPFIVQLHFAFQTADKLYLVMDFMRGGELFFHLRKAKRLDEERAKLYAAEIILAIEYLHRRNIIYRDLKPENILLDYDGHIKLADFGLSKQGTMYGEKSYTFCGTPEYLAPEILLGLGHDKSCDWWSLGSLIYEMLSGAPPFYSRDKNKMFKDRLEKPIPMKPHFSPETCSLLQGLMCMDPEKRLGASIDDANEIKSHSFFQSIDWDFVLSKAYDPPFKPKLSSFKDLTYFDKIFTNEPPKDSPTNGLGKKNENYSNFTYIKKDMNVSNDSMFFSKVDESNEFPENQTFALNVQN